MILYAFSFSLSTLLVFLATEVTHSRFFRFFWTSIAVIVMAVLAGSRDIWVGGPDALYYGLPIFDVASNSSSFSEAYVQAQYVGAKGEPGYIMLNYVVGLFTDSFNAFLFVLALLVNCVVMLAILGVRKLGPAWLMWLTYLCSFYVTTFNLLRQGMALALTILAISLLLNERYKTSFAAGFVGVAFHTSAAFFLPVYATAFIIYHQAGKPTFRIRQMFAVVIVMIAFSAVAIQVLGSGVLEDQYGSYLEDSGAVVSLGADFLYRLVPLLVGFLALRTLRSLGSVNESDVVLEKSSISPPRPKLSVSTRKNRREELLSGRYLSASLSRYQAAAVLFSLLLAELALFPIRASNPTLSRLVMYFTVTRVLGYAVFASNLRANRRVALMSAVLFVSLYFYGMFIATGVGEYSSLILDSIL